MKDKLNLDAYFHIHEKLKDACKPDGHLNVNKLTFKIINIKLSGQVIRMLIKDFETLGLVERINKNKFKVNIDGKNNSGNTRQKNKVKGN